MFSCARRQRRSPRRRYPRPVPRAVVYPGDTVADELLVPRAFIARTVARQTVFEAREAVIGKVARRTLLPGQPIPITYFGHIDSPKKGQSCSHPLRALRHRTPPSRGSS